MKKVKKMLAVVLALTVALTMGIATSFAATGTDSEQGGSATIKVTLPANRSGDNTYKIYKVFDATSAGGTSTAIAYKLIDGKTAPVTATDNLSKFDVDSAGNIQFYSRTSTDAEWAVDTTTTELSAGMISAIATYVRNDSPVVTVTATKDETDFTVTNLEYGYYYITTTTGSVVTVDSTNPKAEVIDKNTLSVVVKSAGTQYDEESMKAIAQVGTKQDFTAQITVGEGATKLVFSDTMTNMTYVADSLVVKKGTTTLAADTDYTLSVADGNGSFTVTFLNVATSFKENDVITLNYKGLVTSDALSKDPANNKATLTTDNNNTSESDPVNVYNAKFTVTKQDESNQPLANAGFVIKNSAGAYYSLASDKKSITWYTLGTDEELADAIAAGNVTEYKSDATGAVPAFTGLGNGTYTLVESTTPAGYNTAADKNFTISGSDFTTTNLEQGSTVVNKSGAELPSTGGIGTTIFYILGALLVIVCGVVLVARRRMTAK